MVSGNLTEGDRMYAVCALFGGLSEFSASLVAKLSLLYVYVSG